MTKDSHEEQASITFSPVEIACEHEPELDGDSDEDGVPTITVSFAEATPPVIVEGEATDVPVSEFPADPAITPLPPGDEEEQAAEDDVAEESVTIDTPAFPDAIEQTALDGEKTAMHPLTDSVVVEPVVLSSAPMSPDSTTNNETEVVQPAPSGVIPPSRALIPYRPTSKFRRNTEALLERIRDVLLGEQRLEITAAAVIETPLRVQPDQAYTIRIQVMGRDAAIHAHAGHLQNGSKGSASSNDRQANGGLSALAKGDKAFIEVRSAIYERYAYVVQKAEVTLPASGYVAEVTIPLRPLSQGPSGRRDRLHIFFLGEKRQPLYEKPFVVELFISHRVQPGHEGHNVLTIPM